MNKPPGEKKVTRNLQEKQETFFKNPVGTGKAGFVYCRSFPVFSDCFILLLKKSTQACRVSFSVCSRTRIKKGITMKRRGISEKI